ncbi:uncharacterized protein [Equus asinus]|uniref:uncharacterized protein n=1 Tax=Equus asinus TaxID=9793 RepID=UPI0038F81F0F
MFHQLQHLDEWTAQPGPTADSTRSRTDALSSNQSSLVLQRGSLTYENTISYETTAAGFQAELQVYVEARESSDERLRPRPAEGESQGSRCFEGGSCRPPGAILAGRSRGPRSFGEVKHAGRQAQCAIADGGQPPGPPSSAHFPRRPGTGQGHRFGHRDSSFSRCSPPALARTRASAGRVRQQNLNFHSGSQIEDRKRKQRCGDTEQRPTNRCLSWLSRPRFAAPEAQGAVGAGRGRGDWPRYLSGPLASRPVPAASPLTPSRGRLPGAKGDPGRRPERDGAGGLGAGGKRRLGPCS